ncbi:unnamed protein product, partial [Tetraodon nigroviridis]
GPPRSQPGAPASSAQVRPLFPVKHSHRPGSPELAGSSCNLCTGASTLTWGTTATGPGVPGASPQLLPALPRCDHSQRPGVHGASPQLQQALPARQRSRLGRIGPAAGLLGASPGLRPALPRCDHSSLG